MRLLCLFLLVIGTQASEDWLEGYNGYSDHRLERYYDRKEYEKHDYIERPCSYHDIHCIRRYLSLIVCASLYGPVSKPYIIKSLILDAPNANVSFSINNVALKGLDTGKIEEFYINKKTDTLVLEVVLEELLVESQKTVITYYRKGKEPIEAADYTSIIFKKLSLTLVIRNINHLDYARVHVYAYVSDPKPPMKWGPKLEKVEGVKDPFEWYEKLGLTVREAMTTQAPAFMTAYLQTKICNIDYDYEKKYSVY